MKKKIFCTLISLIMIMSLVGCGSSSNVAATPAPAAPAVTEPAPEPEPEPEVVEEAPVVEETVVEEPASEEEAPAEEPAAEEPVEEEPAEPTEEEIVEAVLANEEFYEDGAFVPKLYAQSLGYKWYGDYGGEVDLSIIVDDVEYFIWYKAKYQTFDMVYTDGEKCYGISMGDLAPAERENIIKLKTGEKLSDDSDLYVKSTTAILYRLSIRNADLKEWDFDDLPKSYAQIDDAPQYFEDGFIDSTKFVNRNEIESDPPLELIR